jgi:hypothetical protein
MRHLRADEAEFAIILLTLSSSFLLALASCRFRFDLCCSGVRESALISLCAPNA